MHNTTHILSLNPGSGTLRFKLIESESESVLCSRLIDHITGDDVSKAAEEVIEECAPLGIDAMGFRVVHGGPAHLDTEAITESLLADLEDVASLAPLHVATDLAVIRACREQRRDTPAYAVFDTTFHKTLPEVARRYAIDDRAAPGIRRFGFHGLAHQFNCHAYAKLTGRPSHACRLISIHLGGGASVCAIRNGESVDTSMGLTPLEGLMMSTRSGDLDPGIVIHLLREGHSIDQLDELLNKKSGLLGVSRISSDIRDIEPAAHKGDPRAELALSIYAYRVRKYIGAYFAILEGCDAIVVSGALAENSPSFRRRVLGGLTHLGVGIDEKRNASTDPERPARIATDTSPIDVWMVPTDEELQIVREVAAQLQHQPA